VRRWPWTLSLLLKVKPLNFDKDCDGDDAHGTVDYAVNINLAYRSKDHKYLPEQTEREQCVKVGIGEINLGTGNFSPWTLRAASTGVKALDCIMVGNGEIVQHLFYQSTWRKVVSVTEVENSSADALLQLRKPTSRLRYLFEVIDDCLCYQTSKGKDEEPEWTRLANFHVVKYLNLYQFSDGSHMPYHKMLVRQLVNPDGVGTVYVSIDDVLRSPPIDNAKYLDVEVMIDVSTIKTQSDVRALFQSHHSKLDACNINPDQLGTLMVSFESPNPDAVITRFGRQPDGLFVAGNCAFGKGTIMTHEEAKVAIIPKFFEDNKDCPMKRENFMKHYIIPFPHIRFLIGQLIYGYLIPKFFVNNTMPARAVLAMSVMGMQAEKIWGGQTGFGHGMPFGWVFSAEHNTGKTEACLLAHGMLGMFHRAIWAGDASKPQMFELLDKQSCLTVFVDDIVINETDPRSRTFAQLGRALYDRTSRAVIGKLRRPYSSAVFTANSTVNDDDKAFQSRMILIKFDELRMPNQEEDAELYNQWLMMRELSSCLAVDFETLLWNGKLDRHAIQDCAAYLQMVVGRKRDRNVNLWGILLYYMLNMNFLFQGSSEDQEDVFKWMIHSVSRVAYEQTNHSGILDQFVICVSKIRADCGTSGICNPLGPQDRTITWDKMRTTAKPGIQNNIAYIALRIDPCIAVIKNVLGKVIQPQHLFEAIDICGWAVRGSTNFYDVGANGWPIKKDRMDVETGTMCPTPLAEGELLTGHMKQMRCVFFKQEDWNRILSNCERSGNVDIDYKNIMVKSANPEIDKYNLYKLACGLDPEEGWFGYRCLGQCTFATFCGALNALNVGSATTNLEIIPEVAKENADAGFGSVESCYKPEALLENFGYNFPDLDAMPPCYKIIPFTSRNGPDDTAHDDPLSFCPTQPPTPPSPTTSPAGVFSPTGVFSPNSTPRRPSPNRVFSPRGVVRDREDYEQSGVVRDPPPIPGNPGSSPLGDISNGRDNSLSGSPNDRPVKRRRSTTASRFIFDEAEDEDEEEDEQV